ncbi:hypothetical protein HMPREF9318_00667 [Streptococcus urinalis FB127-CNA-2]|uniref:Cystathionine beta-lyase n=1 Tax=Streptococcus urinalis 2285-97 TaxID=764291 RepID=G5KH29_9STRE|nr:hypothetical protein [Streptococcus urinalis]EHJ55982.1 hypothetical protein STRUR_1423 [Streptococcus urinalis 2285-97]EKS22469.1 hypothetical protein HMPREF9318_00667 [Streptococcus urinalis FB127-CNA-2]VEF32282.1 cystathionine beta-lyase [Streptococcus urinalis]
MTDFIQLAKTYGGFTSLDTVYLTNILKQLTDQQKLQFITPPPSVLNAYFAEIYQKKSPEKATQYYFDLSKSLSILNENPSFQEEKPFVRLNLLGKSFGYCYKNEDEEAIVFSEKKEIITDSILFELASVFPNYLIYIENDIIKMKPFDIHLEVVETLEQNVSELAEVEKLTDNVVKLSSFNQEDLVTLKKDFEGELYYHSKDRKATIFVKKK